MSWIETISELFDAPALATTGRNCVAAAVLMSGKFSGSGDKGTSVKRHRTRQARPSRRHFRPHCDREGRACLVRSHSAVDGGQECGAYGAHPSSRTSLTWRDDLLVVPNIWDKQELIPPTGTQGVDKRVSVSRTMKSCPSLQLLARHFHHDPKLLRGQRHDRQPRLANELHVFELRGLFDFVKCHRRR